MANRVMPFLRLAVLCHNIERDELQRPVALIDPLHTITLSPVVFGQQLTAMYLYAQMEDAVGTFEFSVRIEDENREPIAQPTLAGIEHTFEGGGPERIIPFEMTLRLSGLVLPSPGVYYFIIRADTTSLHQRESAARAPLLRVLSL